MSIKLIVTDLDGTLMAPDHTTVTERTRRALKEAHDKGVKTAIATGRTISLIGMVTNQVDFIDYVIYSNGAAVYDRVNKKLIYTSFFDTENALELAKFLDSEPVFYEIYANGWSYIRNDKVSLFDMGNLPKDFIDEITKHTVFVDDMCEIIKKSDVEKFNISSMAPERAEYITEKLISFKDTEWTSSLPGSKVQNQMEFMKKGVNKGAAVKGMCSVLGISPESVMAFGDAQNDGSMLELAGWSFAMGNACEECRQTAKYITDTNANNGLAKAVEEYVLNK